MEGENGTVYTREFFEQMMASEGGGPEQIEFVSILLRSIDGIAYLKSLGMTPEMMKAFEAAFPELFPTKEKV